MDYFDFELDVLHNLFRGEEDKMAAELLSGASWEETTEQRKRLTEVAAAIFYKYYPNKDFNRQEFKYYIPVNETEQKVKRKPEVKFAK